MARNGIQLLIALLLGSLLVACAAQAAWEAGTDLPDLSKNQLEGALPDLDGKVVLVDFWASWCAPCKKSFPTLDALQKKHGDAGLVILAISVDQTAKAMQSFLENRDVSFSIVRDSTQKLIAAAGVNAMPTSFLVDRAGKIRYMHTGYRGKHTAEEYEAEIVELLKEEK